MDTLEELKQLIHEKFEIETSTLKPDVPLTEYGLDSLSLAELLFTIEAHFDIDFPDRKDINTLRGLAGLIDELRVAQQA